MEYREERAKKIELVADGLLDVRQAEDFSGLKKSKLYVLMASGDLPYCEIGAAMRIPKRALVEFLADNLITGGR